MAAAIIEGGAVITVTTAAIEGGTILTGMAIAPTAAGIGIMAADMDIMGAAGAAAMRPSRLSRNPAVEAPFCESFVMG